MQIVPADLNIPFLKYARQFAIMSSVLVGISLLLWLIFGLKYGIDFSGGTELQIRFEKAGVQGSEIRDALAGLQPEPEVQHFGLKDGKHEYLIKLSNISFVSDEMADEIETGLKKEYSDENVRNFGHRTVGGDFLEFVTDKKIAEDRLRKDMEAYKITVKNVVTEGAEGRWIHKIELAGLSGEVMRMLSETFGAGSTELLREDSVGPKVGAELKQKGLKSILFALVMILAYIGFRFNLVFAPGAVVALIHDVLITVGVFVILGVQFTIPTIAALLTIVGYSLNDTIVVYDRIRENLSKTKTRSLEDVVNESINQTLSRTLLTSLTTLVVVVCLFVFGGGIIHDFALALLIGVLVGTYSSVYIASPVMILIDGWVKKREELSKA